jgi:hypothetical protein
MNQLPSCPQCGERSWQRNVYTRYNEPEHIWAFDDDGHTVVNRPDIKNEFEAYEATNQRGNLDEWGNPIKD